MIGQGYGRMVVLNDDTGSVSIVCDNGTYIALENSGIFIVAEEKITFRVSKEISLSVGAEIQLSAEDEISIKCKDTETSVTEEKMKGADIPEPLQGIVRKNVLLFGGISGGAVSV